MPTVNLPQADELSGQLNLNSLYKSYLDLFDTTTKLRKELNFLMNNLDSDNVVSLTVDKLIAGTATISTALIDTLTVGDNVIMGANAAISWGQVTGQPFIPTQYTDAMALTKINATYIDVNGVWTPNVYAQNINTLFAKISTAQIDSLTVGSNVGLGTAKDAAGVTTIVGNTVTTGYVNALGITSQRLTVVDGVTLLDSYKDTNGGKMLINDSSGNLNVKIGVEGVGGQNVGGTVVLYNDSVSNVRVGLGTYGAYDSGFLDLKSATLAGVYIAARQSGVPFIGLYDDAGTLKSSLTASGGTINGAQIATQSYVTIALSGYATTSYVTSQGYITSSALSGYATQSYVTSQGYITSSALTGYATQSYVTSRGYVTESTTALLYYPTLDQVVGAGTGGTKVIDYINASAFGITVRCTDGTTLNFTKDP